MGPDVFRAAIGLSLVMTLFTYVLLSPRLSWHAQLSDPNGNARKSLTAIYPRRSERIAIAIQAGVFTTIGIGFVNLVNSWLATAPRWTP